MPGLSQKGFQLGATTFWVTRMNDERTVPARTTFHEALETGHHPHGADLSSDCGGSLRHRAERTEVFVVGV